MRSRTGAHGRAGRHLVMAGIAVALVSLVLPGCGGSSTDTSSTGLVLDSCTVDGTSAQCGTLMVPEDRLSRSGRQIPIRVAVIPASDPRREPDPIVWFAGGPGGSAVDMAGRVRPLIAADTSRDLVFIEQRGTGASKVTCPAFPGDLDKAALRSAVESCLAGLHEDVRFYTTAMFADDVDEVLSELHYDKANLVGISYGATAEQVFLMRHRDRVRTMTLLSGTLLDVPVFEQFPESGQRALDRVFDECEQTPACDEAFPALRDDWAALWGSVNSAPWVVPAEQSPTGTDVIFDSSRVASSLHDLLFVATTHTRIPLIVHTLGASEDRVVGVLAIAKAYPEPAGTSSDEALMLSYATRCNEPWARNDPDKLIGTDSFEYGLDRASAEWWQEVCTLMPKPPDSAAQPELTKSDVPVLAVNGEEDPQDPPANMAGAHAIWPNSLELTVPGQGHDIDPTSAACAIPLIKSFIEQGTVTGLDTTCLSQLPPPKFDLTLPGS